MHLKNYNFEYKDKWTPSDQNQIYNIIVIQSMIFKYRGNELAIFQTYLRRAFLIAKDGKSAKETSLMDQVFTLTDKAFWVNLMSGDVSKADKGAVNAVSEELPNGSEMYLAVKKFVEENAGITERRGFRY